jgi:hypothetical protein
MLELHRHENGCYLVRKTARNENILVLSLMFNGEFFNYEICAKDTLTSSPQPRLYYIDDGPYFRSLSHLVEHYCRYEDGLPGLLAKLIRPHPVSMLQQSNGSGSIKLTSASSHHHRQMQSNLIATSSSASSTSSTSSSSSSVSNASSSQALILNQLIKVIWIKYSIISSYKGTILKTLGDEFKRKRIKSLRCISACQFIQESNFTQWSK